MDDRERERERNTEIILSDKRSIMKLTFHRD